MKNRIKKDKVKVITLGCSKNLVDSENIVTQLIAGNVDAEHESNQTDANVVVINTCGFIETAKEESIQTIFEYIEAKKEKAIDKLYVTGCLSHRYKNEMEAEMPEVDAFFGTMELPALLQRFQVDYRHELLGERQHLTPPHYAYLKISEGCNRTCSFCAIPMMRGKHVSKPIAALVQEAKNLATRGVKELILIAQELTYYGLDLYKKRKLTSLLEALSDVEGIHWIRLHYAYPSKFPVEIFDVMSERENMCNYLDIPLQHADDEILASMRRQITVRESQQLIDLARKKVPDIALRTTMLVGFPGEKEHHFQNLYSFVKENRFDRLGVFEYSHEEDTTAYLLPDDVSAQTKSDRAARLMNLQQAISREKNEAKLNQVFDVLFDRKESGYFYGRTRHDSPEVDNEVLVSADQYVRVGDFAKVHIDDCTEYDLYGHIIRR